MTPEIAGAELGRWDHLVLAQRAAVDVLDTIAVAATDYLKLPGSPQQAYFGTRWHTVDKRRQFIEPLQWQPEIQAAIAAGNRSLIALAETRVRLRERIPPLEEGGPQLGYTSIRRAARNAC